MEMWLSVPITSFSGALWGRGSVVLAFTLIFESHSRAATLSNFAHVSWAASR